jgi:hypothetical protein
MQTPHPIYITSFASVYSLYIAKAVKKGWTKAEVDKIIRWRTAHFAAGAASHNRPVTGNDLTQLRVPALRSKAFLTLLFLTVK